MLPVCFAAVGPGAGRRRVAAGREASEHAGRHGRDGQLARRAAARRSPGSGRGSAAPGSAGPDAHRAAAPDVRRGAGLDRRRRSSRTAIAATNLLPGPASTQLAIYCAWRLRASPGAVVGGLCFIVPGLILILALSAVFLARHPPRVDPRGSGGGRCGRPGGRAARRLELRPGQLEAHRAATGERSRWFTYAVAGGARRGHDRPVPRARRCSPAGRSSHLRRTARRRGRVGAAASSRARRPLPPPAAGSLAARLGRVQGRRPLLRRRLRDRPAHAARRGDHLPLDDRHPVPERRRARPGHPGPGGPDRRGRRLRGQGRRRRPARHARRVHAVVRLRPRSAVPGSTGSARTSSSSPSSPGPAPAVIGAIAGSAIPLGLAFQHLWQIPVLGGGLLWLFAARRGVVTGLLIAGGVGVLLALSGVPGSAATPPAAPGFAATPGDQAYRP